MTSNFVILGISLAIISGPIAFVAFLLGYNYAKRQKVTGRVIYAVDLPDELPEYRTVIVRHNERHII